MSATTPTYDPQLVDAIATRVVELLRADGGRVGGDEPQPQAGAGRVQEAQHGQAGSPGLVDAATLARELNVSRDWVYRHADQLHSHRLGSGSRGRLRFDLEAAKRGTACYRAERSETSPEGEIPSDIGTSRPSARRSPPPPSRRLPNGLPKPSRPLTVRHQRLNWDD